MTQEINGEWVIGSNVPFVNGFGLEVQTNDNEVRRVQRRPSVDFETLWFVDCTHPAQNAYCQKSRIKAWRVVPQTLS